MVLQKLAAPVWAEGSGQVRILEDLMLGGREEIGGGGMCRDLSWEGGSGNTHKLFCNKSDLGLELIPSFRSDPWSVGGITAPSGLTGRNIDLVPVAGDGNRLSDKMGPGGLLGVRGED